MKKLRLFICKKLFKLLVIKNSIFSFFYHFFPIRLQYHVLRILIRSNIDLLPINDYKTVLYRLNIPFAEAWNWGLAQLSIGRMDLNIITLEHQLTHNLSLALDQRVKVTRRLGELYLSQGKIIQAKQHFEQAGQMRRFAFTADYPHPQKYRVLCESWTYGIGHVACLDYYLKYAKLYYGEDVRIVVSGKAKKVNAELTKKFEQHNIYFFDSEEELAKDYDVWANGSGHPSWNQLSPVQRNLLYDSYFHYDFPDGEILVYGEGIARIEREWVQTGRGPLIVLTEQERDWISQLLIRFGAPKNAWYVCLHVRTSGFHGQINKLYPSLRDAEITDYIPAIKKIVEMGGWVIRMGDPSMPKLPEMPQVIDYAHHPLKSPRADVLLPGGCRFFIATNSGYMSVADMYHTSCLLTNWIPISFPMWTARNTIIPKLFKRRDNNLLMNLEEVLSTKLASIQNITDLPDNIIVIPNTSEDILEATIDMLNPRKCAKRDKAMENYKHIAKKHGYYTGSLLSASFVERYPQLFFPEHQNELLQAPIANEHAPT